MKRLPLVADFILFIALCVSAAYWGMQLFKPPVRPVAAPPQTGPVAPRIEAAAGLFGGRPTGAVVASNYQLKGVIAAGPDGVAILSADGKPPQAVGVDMEIVPGVTVKEVHRQYVMLNEGGVVKRVDLPENAKGGIELGGQPPVSTAPSEPQMPAPTMSINNGQMPNGNRAAIMPPPSSQSAPMQPIMPPPPPPQAESSEASPPNPIPGGGHPGLITR